MGQTQPRRARPGGRPSGSWGGGHEGPRGDAAPGPGPHSARTEDTSWGSQPARRAALGHRYLWLRISTVPYCSIHSFPMITLCTQQVGLVQV